MSQSHVSVEEHVHGDTKWVALRSRGAEWSWLTPEEAVKLAQEWLQRYSQIAIAPALVDVPDDTNNVYDLHKAA